MTSRPEKRTGYGEHLRSVVDRFRKTAPRSDHRAACTCVDCRIDALRNAEGLPRFDGYIPSAEVSTKFDPERHVIVKAKRLNAD